MYEMKTKLTNSNVEDFLNTIKNDQKRIDAFVILDLMQKVCKSKPKMWGTGIIGFGNSSYKLSNGKEVQWFKVGFSPRKVAFVLYIKSDFGGFAELLIKLGKYKTSKSCLYFNKLADVDISVLRKLIKHSLTCF